MPKLTIDNRSIEVPKGTKVITAAEKLGIMIPRFCYHPALGAVGACRVCAVNFMEGPIRGIRMSCMVAAADGMIVSTTDAEAVDFRRHVIEWLMLNHPHDCPVCDEGGHCLLQDMTISGGHGLRRYQGKKRTYQDQYLGPLVGHEMNRCIQCYRCVRLYREYCGYTDLGVMGSASRVYFGRQKEGTLQSPFAGNLIDICPTGVFTDRPSRHNGRRWDFERTASICTHCALGCNTVVSVRNREIVRQEARFNPDVNGHFICDRGRYGFAFANVEERPRMGRIQGQDSDLRTTLDQINTALTRIVKQHGSKAVAVIGSGRSSLETLAAIKKLCQRNDYLPPVLFPDKGMGATIRRAALNYSTDLAISAQDLAQADLILVVGADPLNEAPMLALSLRKAQLNGGVVAVVDPRAIELPLEFFHLTAGPDTISARLSGLIQAGIKPDILDQMPEAAERIAALESVDIGLYDSDGKMDAAVVAALKQSTRPAILCGTHICDPLTVDVAVDAVQLLRKSGKAAGLLFLFPEANSMGAGLMANPQTDPEDLMEKVEKDQVKAVIAVENDPLMEFVQRTRLEKALNKLELLVGMDYIYGPFAAKTHLFLPLATMDECGGTYVNTHALAQTAPAAFTAGTPISQTGKGDHPPRQFASQVPGGALPSPAEVLLDLAGQDNMDLKNLVVQAHDAFAPIARFSQLPPDGLTLSIEPLPRPKLDLRFGATSSSKRKEDGGDYMLILVEWTFGTERCSALSPFLMQQAKTPYLSMHPDDALKLGLAASPKVVITADGGDIVLPLRVNDALAPGVMVLPCHFKLDWQLLSNRRMLVHPGQINAHAKE